jgi:hypothetical protein
MNERKEGRREIESFLLSRWMLNFFHTTSQSSLFSLLSCLTAAIRVATALPTDFYSLGIFIFPFR